MSYLLSHWPTTERVRTGGKPFVNIQVWILQGSSLSPKSIERDRKMTGTRVDFSEQLRHHINGICNSQELSYVACWRRSTTAYETNCFHLWSHSLIAVRNKKRRQL